MSIVPGTVLEQRYRVLRRLRREGLGEVFSAEDSRTGAVVAVKVLGAPPGAMDRAEAAARFRHEALACARLRGPHTLPSIHGGRDAEHGPLIVFELRDGEILSERIARTGPIPFEVVHPLAEQLWLAIAELHELGIVHRDIRSSNVLIDRGPGGERLTLLDLGSCKLPPAICDEELPKADRPLGDLRFIPPEQIQGAGAVDHRADIYAAMTVVFEALTAEVPFAARNLVMLADLKARTAPRRLGSLMPPPVDRQLEVFVNRGLANNPERRFAAIADVLEGWRALRPASS